MEKNWTLIYNASKLYDAEMLKTILIDNEIVCEIINKKDSSYLFGVIEVYVQDENLEKAKKIVVEFNA